MCPLNDLMESKYHGNDLLGKMLLAVFLLRPAGSFLVHIKVCPYF